jgi:hypothetical protein
MATPLTTYNFSNADLMQLASNYVTFMTRDTTEFAVRGVTAIDITDFQALGNAFEVFPADAVYQADVTIEVNAKNAARDAAMISIQLIEGFFEQQWGATSPQYKKLRVKGLSRASDNLFLSIARGVVTQSDQNLATLTLIGMTQAMIDALTADAQTMEDKMNSVVDKESIRESKTVERVDDGNELYSFVQKYSKIGKAIWENVDEVKYKDYVINPTIQSALGKVQNLAGVFIPASGAEVDTIDLSWDAVAGASGYQLFVAIMPVGVPPTLFAILDITPNTTYSHAPLPLVPSDYYYKVRAETPTEQGADSDVELVQAV